MARDDGRRAILDSIRSSLAASRPHEAAYAEVHAHHTPRPPTPGGLPVLGQGRSVMADAVASLPAPERFARRLEMVGGAVVRVADEAAAAAEVARILDGIGARRVARSDAPLAARVLDGAAGAGREVVESPPLEQLFECDAGVTSAAWAIADSGTLVIESARERNRLASLVPPVHIAVLPVGRLRATLGDVLREVHAPGTELSSRAITLITGPSRTADIEQTLIMGVHGPQQIHVILIGEPGEDPPAAAEPEPETV